MKRLPLWAAGVAALALAATVYVACSGASSQEPTPIPSPSPSYTPTSVAAAVGPPQVEAGAPTDAPTVEPPKGEAEVVYVGPRDVKAVALTFDTGGPAGHVREILDILKERGKLATFGITGEWAVTNPSLLKRIVEEGHAVINHSWSHTSFTGEDTETEPLTAEQMRDELERTEEKIDEIAGVTTKPYFRPPYGDYDRLVNQVIREAGYEYNVLWLVDSAGWEGRSTKSVVAVTLANARNGAIFLYHTDNARDPAALEEIIEGLDERGLQMVTIPQLLGKKPMPTPTPTGTPTATPEPTSAPILAGAPPVSSGSGPVPAPASTPTPTPTGPPAPTPIPTPTPVPYVTVAYDGFESGDAGGGSGWLGPWQSDRPFVTSGDAPHSGNWQLDVSSGGCVFRSADLGGYEKVNLRFWSRLSGLDPSDKALVMISPGNGLPFQVVKEFTATESDGVYRLYDIDLSAYPMTAGFLVGFCHLVDSPSDQWHIDDVELVTVAP